ncbi:MAG: methylenetetrahydrofolate reductase [Chloroflexi bacterium AL-N5]|nr:methylenetetrahydrofolate reductase [Chloroflexi bacterium AL-N5]
MRISVELVPRTAESLEKELELLRKQFPTVTTVNIPDLMRFPLRSWQACAIARPFVANAIPHIRAIDIDLKRPLPMAAFLEKHDIREVIVVAGDAPVDMSRAVYSSSSLQVIRKFQVELPGIRVYAALDPYRQSFQKELAYAQDKLEAGACGLFTQPFFDLRLMEIYADLLPNVEVFWGVTSVTSSKSLNYWQHRNKAVIPADFEPTLGSSQQLAARALAFAKRRNANLYLMPIRTDLQSYLSSVLVQDTF